jgi:hypothetical protein
MAVNFKEVSSVWVLKDMKYTTYEEGEDLVYESFYGLFDSYKAAERASKLFSEQDDTLPKGNWIMYDQIVYG